MVTQPSNPAPTNSGSDLSRLLSFLRGLSEERFWGNLAVKFEDGRPIYIKQERGWKVHELPSGTPRYDTNGSTK